MDISEADLARLGRAITIATKSEHRFRLGAVIYSSGRFLSAKTNKKTNSPAYVDHHFCSVHAEIRALRSVRNPRGATCYVARVAADDSTALARPCDTCWDRLAEAGIQRVVWTTATYPEGAKLTNARVV